MPRVARGPKVLQVTSVRDEATTATPASADTNAYWEAVRKHVKIDRVMGAGPVVDTYGALTGNYQPCLDRHELTSRYSWTVTDPATVQFVRQHAGNAVIDPLAGSGWWARLVQESGARILASDINPPDGTPANNWHREAETHVEIDQMDAVEAITLAGPYWTLLLSWPPYESDTGERALRAYQGERVIYIGEGWGGNCGNDAMFETLERDWEETAAHRPVQWYGLRDYVTVYERKQA